MNSATFADLGKRVAELLKIGPGCEVEISLLRSGQILLSRTGEKDGKKDATPAS